ncbi:histidine triad nucleotide-binding protein [Alphaproteobacteria bacterium]|nr:histidine triad nucleotide-binding protein [Alphaproteobacteria bacterium]
MVYDKNNVFYKILQSEIPSRRIYEDDLVLVFHDINPVCKIHALVITKGLYMDFHDFVSKTSPEETRAFFRAVATVAELLEIDKSGYRIISNIGKDSRQEIQHFHVHILGGEQLG